MFRLFLALWMFCSAANLLAEEPNVTSTLEGVQDRKNVWTFGVGSTRHLLQAYGDNDLMGFTGVVSLGYGYLQRRWFFHGTIDQILGPFVPIRNEQLNVDYSGTGFSLWVGAGLKQMDLRSTFGGYGFALGVNYLDIVGRQIGKNRNSTDDPYDSSNSYLIRDYKSKITSLSLIPAFFATWLNAARPEGNSPELLKTRIEGVMATLGISIPVVSYYRNRYTTKQDTADGKTQTIDVTEKGSFTGYSAVMNVSVFFGS